MTRVLPIMRDRLVPHFPGPESLTIASVVTRIALSHAVIADDPELFYAELRHAAGLKPVKPKRRRPARRRPARRILRNKVR
jgi:hypothetical protein